MIRLTIKDSAGSRTLTLDRSELLVGRRDGADLQLDDPDLAANHCLVRIEDGRLKVIDLGSKGGVVVSGRRIPEAFLARGDHFRIGSTVVSVVAYTGARATTPVLEPDTPAEPAPKPAAAPIPHAQPHSEFEREIRAMIAQSPWYMTSAGIHIVLLLLVHLLTLSGVERRIPAMIMADANTELADPDEIVPRGLLEPDMDEIRPDDPDELEFLEPEEASPETELDPLEREFRASQLAEPSPVIGTRSSLAQRLTRPLSGPQLNKASDAKINRGDLDGEHRGAKAAVEQGIGSGMRNLRALPPDRIVVVRGDFDQMESILDLYEIPHTTVDRNQFRRRKFPRAKMLCLNCDQHPPPAQRKELVDKVRDFVRRGGWLITSDWAVDPYLTAGFPDKVLRVVRKRRNQPDTTITVRRQESSPLLDGVFPRRSVTEWWLEDASFMVEVNDRLVDVLIVSDDMKRRFGGHAVAFTWREKQGRVLHLLGHFYQKDGNRSGLVAMQRLIVNYLRERFPVGR